MDKLKTNRRKGFTLLETVIALGIWLILAAAVFFVWRYAAAASAQIIARQNAFENARVSMDAIIMNIQLTDVIYLETHTATVDGKTVSHVLRRLVMPGINPQGNAIINYTFEFDITLPADSVRRHRLEFGSNEFASHIALVRIMYLPGRRMDIEIHTDCAVPIVLEASVDVRYKKVVLLAPGQAVPLP